MNGGKSGGPNDIHLAAANHLVSTAVTAADKNAARVHLDAVMVTWQRVHDAKVNGGKSGGKSGGANDIHLAAANLLLSTAKTAVDKNAARVHLDAVKITWQRVNDAKSKGGKETQRLYGEKKVVGNILKNI